MSFKNHEDSVDCWCGTTLMQVCPACEHEVDPPTWCRECGGTGTVPKYDDSLPVIIVHRDRRVTRSSPERDNLAAIGAFVGTAIIIAIMALGWSFAGHPRLGEPAGHGASNPPPPRDFNLHSR